ncbi:MAG: 50S ribosomal protein L29 [Clostridia bacterium]|nr:50S ribosomal protein L29 [Clostridia bacterium]
MKAEEIKKLREMSAEDLAKKEQELKEELFNLRFQQATGQLRNPLRIRECKRDIARVKTIACERRLNA